MAGIYFIANVNGQAQTLQAQVMSIKKNRSSHGGAVKKFNSKFKKGSKCKHIYKLVAKIGNCKDAKLKKKLEKILKKSIKLKIKKLKSLRRYIRKVLKYCKHSKHHDAIKKLNNLIKILKEIRKKNCH